MAVPTYKCVLYGDGGCGKTALVRRHLTGDFNQSYTPTLGVEVWPIVFRTTGNQVRFNIWDTAGQDRFGGLRQGYCVGANCAIIMFDLTQRTSYQHLDYWFNCVRDECGQIPIVVVGNKSEAIREITPEDITFPQEHGLQYYEISVKSNINITQPFVYLTRELVHQPNIDFR